MMDKTIYIQPFIKIPAQYYAYTEKIWTCGEHLMEQGDRFCSRCGKPGFAKEVHNKCRRHISDLVGNENLWQYQEGESLFLFSSPCQFSINTGENHLSFITPELIEEDIAKFTECHKEDIEKLEDVLGMSVKVDFGFVYEVC